MSNLAFEYQIREPKIKLDKNPLLLLLHGYGSNEADLFSFADELPEEYYVVSARAPYDLQYGSYAWYAINFDANQNNLDNYFRSLCQLLHFIDTSSIDISDSYAQFIIAQLSSHELSILFYSGLNMTDGIKLKNYIEKFGLLQNLDESLVFNKEHINAYQFQSQTK